MVMFSYTGIYKTKSSSYAYTSGNHTPSRATERANSLFTVMPHAIYSNLIDTYGYFCGLQFVHTYMTSSTTPPTAEASKVETNRRQTAHTSTSQIEKNLPLMMVLAL